MIRAELSGAWRHEVEAQVKSVTHRMQLRSRGARAP